MIIVVVLVQMQMSALKMIIHHVSSKT